jgi:hypothetical protein
MIVVGGGDGPAALPSVPKPNVPEKPVVGIQPPAPVAPEPERLPEKWIELTWQPGTHGLHFMLSNKTADLIRGCEVHVTDVRRWSTTNKKYLVNPKYHPNGSFRRIKLHGPPEVYPEREITFNFISFGGGGQTIGGTNANAKAQMAINLPVDEPGMWAVDLSVRAQGRERVQQAFYRLEDGKRPEPMEMTPQAADAFSDS